MKATPRQAAITYLSKERKPLTQIGMLICASLSLCAAVPIAYGRVGAIWARLPLAAAGAAGLFFLLRRLYALQYGRQHGHAPERGDLRSIWLYAAASFAPVLLLHVIFGAVLQAIRIPPERYRLLLTYGSAALSVFLFPVTGLLLYTPLVARGGFLSGISAFLGSLRRLYLRLFIFSAVNTGVTALLSKGAGGTFARAVLSLFLSTLLWVFTWESGLCYYRRESAAGTSGSDSG
jgi:hypothetical protein